MEIKTVFDIGQIVWTVRNCKAVQFEITAIMADKNGVRYVDGDYMQYPECECFASKDLLIEKISADE